MAETEPRRRSQVKLHGPDSIGTEGVSRISDDNVLEVALGYIRALESNATGDELARHLAPSFQAHEWPNALAPKGSNRNFDQVLDAAGQSAEVVSDQRFVVENSMVNGSLVVLEIAWSGVLKFDIANWPQGHRLRARTAVFLQIADGRIQSQRSYDSYLPE